MLPLTQSHEPNQLPELQCRTGFRSAFLLTKTLPEVKPDPAVIARIPPPEGRATYIAAMERAGKAVGIMSKFGNIVARIAIYQNKYFYQFVFRSIGIG